MIAANTRVLSAHLTGVQRYTVELLKCLGSEVEMISPSRRLPGMLGHVWEQLVLPGRLNNSFLWSPSNTGPLSVRRQVVTIHDVVSLDHPEWLNPRFAAWYRWLIPRLARKVTAIITDSESTKQRLLGHVHIDESKVSVVHLGVDGRFAPARPSQVEDSIRTLGIPSPYYVLSLCSLEPRKNLGRLLEAWRRGQGELPSDLWLVLAGARGRKDIFGSVDLSNIPPNVYFTGYVSDELVPPLYSGALAFAYISVYEGFGLPPLEAMAAGTAVLTGNQTSIPEVVGDAALTVNPYDVDAIANGLVRLANDGILREDLGRRGIERARQFSWDICAERTLSILMEAAESA